MRTSARIIGVVILVLLGVNALVWYATLHVQSGTLMVAFLDVEQGDAIFIRAPSGHTVLIDGGPSGGLLRRLGEVLPWYTHTIDVVIPTHPDADHITGLVDVLEHYQVHLVLQSSVEGVTPIWHTLERDIENVAQKGAIVETATRGQVVDLGGSAYLEILSPDRNVPHVDTNTGCVVVRLVYGDTAFMLSCDAPQSIEKYLVHLDGHSLHSDVLKAGHHGSKTSSSELFVGFVDPRYVVYSRGCANTYGFPHQQTIDTMTHLHIQTLDTCLSGTIVFESDGRGVTHL